MIDSILYAVRDAIRGGGFGYDFATCDIRDDGSPPPRCGDWYVSVHQAPSRSTMKNALNVYYGYSVTLSARVTIPLDRVGDQLLVTAKLAKKLGFNRRAEQLSNFLHMNWGVLQDANTYMCQQADDGETVYGFCEPSQFMGMETPVLVGGEWFKGDPEDQEVGLKAEMNFSDARRLQGIGAYV